MSRNRIVALTIAGLTVGALAVSQVVGGDAELVDVAAGEVDTEPQSEPVQTTSTTLSQAPENLGPVPELVDLDGWLQTEGTSFETVKGEVTILQFWTYTCHNCTATIPFLQDIYATHQPNGLEIIGVHAPEFEREKDPVGIQEAADRLGVSWPIALDTEKKNFRSWQGSRRFWPRTYVIDQNGDIRFDKIGEGKYAELEATVAHLLENGP
ncbi:MAG: redoxin domain-containing protein [Acidimicrobiales bacterium]